MPPNLLVPSVVPELVLALPLSAALSRGGSLLTGAVARGVSACKVGQVTFGKPSNSVRLPCHCEQS